MDPAGGPDAKKPRWSPAAAFPGPNAANSASTPTRDAFANYGYGPQASISQNGFNGSPSGGFNGSPLYSTPTLGINTNVNGNGLASQLSPSAAAAAFAQQQQQQQQQAQAQANANGNAYGAFGAYSMLGMGIPGMNMLGGFPYGNQMANFAHVNLFLTVSLSSFSNLLNVLPRISISNVCLRSTSISRLHSRPIRPLH
jgi:hypothetical protein